MQTLTAGSFLNLENDGNVEALKFTARRLAEHTGGVVKENLQPAARANLASNLWEKAEYVARETERRRLREIFTENFTERFRELKPEFSLADELISKVLSTVAATENGGSVDNAPALENVEESESETAATESEFSASPPTKTDVTEVQEKRDEFLGFVKTDEPFAAAPVAETEEAAAATVSSEAKQETIQAADAPASETLNSKEESATERDAVANSEGERVAEREAEAESASKDKSSPAAVATVAAGNGSQVASANKNGTSKTETKEPFEFGKCTISLNLVLLPSSAGESRRKAIIAASSHNQPPEIEFLEIAEGEDLTEIAELVRGKLARFKNTLPAKYIEQLRQSKTKSAKKSVPAKIPTAAVATTKPTVGGQSAEETIGSEPTQSSSSSKAEVSQTESTATKETEAAQFVSTVAVVPQSVAAANNVQPSLF